MDGSLVGCRGENSTWTATGDEIPAESTEGVRGLRNNQLGVEFQPIVDVATGRALAFEALVRCKDPRYPSPPALFEAAVAEQSLRTTRASIREVAFATCGDNALFVNLHPDELASRWLVKPDDPIGFHDRPVYLEVTESAALTHFDLCVGVLRELCRRTGAHLVIDDFGAGYSNLERLADMEPAMVKLDLVLARNIHQRPRRQIVIRHVVQMCKALGARVVAEGVETLDELKCLCDLGVDYAQGYLLARPAAPPPPHAWPLQVKPTPGAPAPRRQPPPLPGRRSSSTAPTVPPVRREAVAPAPARRSNRAGSRSSKTPARPSKPSPRG